MTQSVDLTERRARLSPEKQALLAKRRQGQGIVPKERTIPRRPVQTVAPLSFAQERLWFLDQLEPGNPIYNRPFALRLTGSLDQAVLEQSLSEILRRHEVLRATFSNVEGEAVQVIKPPQPLSLPLIELNQLPLIEGEAQALQFLVQEAQRPFDLSQGPLLRAHLLRLAAESHILLIVAHHIVFDGWSAQIFIKELAVLYDAFVAGRPSPLPELAIQYADFAYWQRQRLQEEAVGAQLLYWQERLAGAPPALDLPADHPRPANQSYRGAHQLLLLPAELVRSLSQLSQQEGVTLFMTLLAAFQTLLYRYTGQEDLVIGSPIAGRTHVETEGLIGFCINTLVLRTEVSNQLTFRELLERVREVALGAYTHQELPFQKLLEAMSWERDPSRTPLFQVMFNLENVPEQQGDGSTLAIHEVRFESGAAPFDLTLEVIEEAGGLSCFWQYNTDLFEATTLTRMANHYRNLLQSVVADPNQRLSELPLLSEAERRQLLVTWNETQADYPHDRNLVQLFMEQVERTPEGIAYICEGERLSYRELNRRANQVAHYLQRLKVGPEVVVGLCLERSFDLVVGLLGILKAGGAYLPLDPTYPSPRLAFMLADAGVQVLLTQERLVGKLPGSVATLVRIDTDWPDIAQQSFENPINTLLPDQPAYVIYTSGSTGLPKGVVGLHRATVNRCAWMWSTYPFQAGEVCCHKTTLSFVDAVWEIFGPLLQGIPTLLIPDLAAKDPLQLIQLLAEYQVSRLVLVPSLLQALLEAEPQLSERLSRLKYWITSGEALAPALYHHFQRVMPQACLLNLYGSSEVAADATWFELGQDELLSTIPIGRPVANTQVYILDRYLHPTPIGVAGELYIGGAGLARGYLQRPELTAERFIPNPFSLQAGERLYKTGDLVRYLPDGNIEFLGRIDHQVKIRGFRIEPGEIEAILKQHPAIREGVVVAREDNPGDRRLVAYLVIQQSPEPTVGELREFLRGKLPEYMAPSAYVLLERLPLTPNGKLDRRALPAPEQNRPALDESLAAPRNELERQLVQAWEEVLAVQPIGIRDSFFDLGGHSLLAVRLVARIKKITGKDLHLSTLFQARTIEQQATMLQEGSMSLLLPLQPNGTKLPFFCVPGVGDNAFIFTGLAHHLGPEQPFYAFRFPEGVGEQSHGVKIKKMAAQYIQEMRQLQPDGPYLLGGYCFGGKVAFEMAQQLYAQGHKVGFVGLFESYLPVSSYIADFEQRVRYHLDNFLKLSLQGKVRLALELGRRRFLKISGKLSPNLARPMSQALGEINYIPQSYPGRLTLFHAIERDPNLYYEPEMGWGGLAAGGIETHAIPGTHINAYKEPHVQIWAEQIRESLDRAQAAG